MEVIAMVGAGVANINAATKLIDNGYEGKIKIIDMGKNPHDRLPEEVMTGMLGAGGWSDGKLTYHTSIGGHTFFSYIINKINLILNEQKRSNCRSRSSRN